MKSILRKVAGIAVATVLVFGMFSCNIGSKDEPTPTEINKEEPAPTKITLVCMECSGTHEIDIEGCITWEDVRAKNRDKLSTLRPDVVYYDDGMCCAFVYLNESRVPLTDVVDVKANYKVGR